MNDNNNMKQATLSNIKWCRKCIHKHLFNTTYVHMKTDIHKHTCEYINKKKYTFSHDMLPS